MRILRALYTFYGLIIFCILFAIFFLLLLIPIIFPTLHKLVGVFNRWWARLLFLFIGIPFQVSYLTPLSKKRQYIFCPNHFSYMDIPAMGLNRINTIFVGKNDLKSIPLFGYMYSQLHITVDRSKLKSRYETMIRTMQALDEGKSLVIFPEGGMITEGPPLMGPFKDGAFRVSIEKQIPIVPVTISNNWIILPADEFLLNWKPLKVTFHEPIQPTGYTLERIHEYKQHVRQVIEQHLPKNSV